MRYDPDGSQVLDLPTPPADEPAPPAPPDAPPPPALPSFTISAYGAPAQITTAPQTVGEPAQLPAPPPAPPPPPPPPRPAPAPSATGAPTGSAVLEDLPPPAEWTGGFVTGGVIADLIAEGRPAVEVSKWAAIVNNALIDAGYSLLPPIVDTAAAPNEGDRALASAAQEQTETVMVTGGTPAGAQEAWKALLTVFRKYVPHVADELSKGRLGLPRVR